MEVLNLLRPPLLSIEAGNLLVNSMDCFAFIRKCFSEPNIGNESFVSKSDPKILMCLTLFVFLFLKFNPSFDIKLHNFFHNL